METRTRIVLLMHPKEYRREKCGTGRLACLNLRNSEIIPGVAFDRDARVRELIDDPANYPVLLYPGPKAMNLSEGEFPLSDLGGRRLVVFLVDSTWSCSKTVLRQSPGLLGLPQLKFEPRTLSRWIIKRQPRDYCLSTIESIHELLIALERAGIDSYPDKERLLSVFAAMQDYQIERAEGAGRPRYKKNERGAKRDGGPIND
jgi:DTW domain-containing protein YfiP